MQVTVFQPFRMATVVAYASEMDRQLRQQRFGRSVVAAQMREQIKAFNSGVLLRPSARHDRRAAVPAGQ